MIQAIIDPKLKDGGSFYSYTRIESYSEIQHMIDVIDHILKNKPEGKAGEYDVTFYSMYDMQGMRFMRQYQDGGWMSDFRHEWNRNIVN